MANPLTARQQRFIDEYLIDLNATQAAIRAGYSENGAKVQGHQLLTNPNVSAEIESQVQALCERYAVSHRNVLSELAAVAFADIRDVCEVDRHGNINARPTSEWSEPAARAVGVLRSTRYGPVLGQHDKLKALDLLGKYLSLWREESQAQTVEFTINVDGERGLGTCK